MPISWLPSGRPDGVLDGSLLEIATQGVVSKALDLLTESFPMKPLDRIDDPRVELAPPFLQKPSIGDLVGERVLERVFEVGKHPRLV